MVCPTGVEGTGTSHCLRCLDSGGGGGGGGAGGGAETITEGAILGVERTGISHCFL